MSELAGSLLKVVTYENREKRKGVPLMMEFSVNAALEPFLVSSTKATLWVGSHNGKVKAAIRQVTDLDSYFWEVVQAVIMEGRRTNWGNVHPLTKAGISEAIEHVRSYDLTELEILANPETDWGQVHQEWGAGEGRNVPLALLGLPLQPARWLPPNTVVVVPTDRDYVGFALLFHERIASVVHNASRGIGVATSWSPQESP